MLNARIQPNEKKAKWLIYSFSASVFIAVVVLARVKINVNLPFDVHILAEANAVLNTATSILLLGALISVLNKKYDWHQRMMTAALVLSLVFLLSYIVHHLFAGEARFGDSNLDGLVSEAEKAAVGNKRYVYYFILSTHIVLAAGVMPFVLFTTYRALTADFKAHKSLAKYTWPIWFYVSVTGPLVYAMIYTYYR